MTETALGCLFSFGLTVQDGMRRRVSQDAGNAGGQGGDFGINVGQLEPVPMVNMDIRTIHRLVSTGSSGCCSLLQGTTAADSQGHQGPVRW